MGNTAQAAITSDMNETVLSRLRACFNSGKTRPLAYRQQQLAGMARFMKEREGEIYDALRQDLGRSALETFVIETANILREVELTRKRLPSWMKPERVRTAFVAQPGKSRIYREPLGVVLVIGAWNYPLDLILVPLIGALAAGNCVVIKPSELAPACSALVARWLPEYVDNDCVQVVEGGVQETTALLAEQFDHIFYTGSGTVARIVMQAAARHLTPVTLELGGKCPCIVDKHTDIKVAARRILWGKLINAGQTCVAPDYVLVHKAVEEKLLLQMRNTLREFFGDDPRSSRDYARIVNDRHYRRLMELITAGGEIVAGGEGDEDERYVAPTILRNVPEDAPAMTEEIFGPILPVLGVQSMDDAIAFVNKRPKALAAYLFSSDKKTRERVVERTSSGGVVINHVCLQFALPSLPFGGVGASGMGAYHGRATFETFSHRKPVVVKPTMMDLPILYPPSGKQKEKWLRRLL